MKKENELDGNTSFLMSQLEEVSKLLEVYTASILDSGF